MQIYCTLFDGSYTARGLALIDSLNEHCGTPPIYILCMDADAEKLLTHLDIPNVILIRLDELETFDRQLADVKSTRKPIEYYFTSKACLLRYVLSNNVNCERVIYLDADLYFFSSPTPLNTEVATASVAVIEHRFSQGNQRLYKFGRFNAGWLSIRNDDAGRRCVEWWRSRCLEWCHDYVDGDRYADQKYLNKFPELFNATVVTHLGANLAPWNIGNYKLTEEGGRIMVDGQVVMFYHFHGLKRLIGPFIESGLAIYRQQLSSVARDAIFAPYLEKCCGTEQKVHRLRQELSRNEVSIGAGTRGIKRGTLARRFLMLLLSILRSLRYKTFIVTAGCSRSRFG